jgi:hypothetical protein
MPSSGSTQFADWWKLIEYEILAVLGFFGALAAQLLVARDFLDRDAKYQLLADKKEYYGKVITAINSEDDKVDKEIEHFQTGLVKIAASGSAKAEAECRKIIDYWKGRLLALAQQRNQVDKERNDIYNQLADMNMWRLSCFVYYSVFFVLLGGFFSPLISYVLSAGGTVTISPQNAVLGLIIGASWPVYFRRLWEKADKAQVADQLIARSAKLMQGIEKLQLGP